jgi:ParB/RepB/Spo0J family partition protein
MTVLIPLDRLHPHPDNPRLAPDADTVERIAGFLREEGRFDPIHALLVRPFGDGYQIVSGHHRGLAAKQAGLTEVPCTVRELSDYETLVLLVRMNTYRELSPLMHGLHALKITEKGRHGKSVKAYAKDIGRPQPALAREVMAARVASYSTWNSLQELEPFTRHLAEIHAASPWLWPALVAKLVEKSWTVEAARAQAGRLKDLSEPPEWADRAAIAAKLVAGEMRPAEVARIGEAAEKASRLIQRDGFQAERRVEELSQALREARPAAASTVLEVAQAKADEQAQAELAADTLQAKAEERTSREAAALYKAVTLGQWKKLSPDVRTALLNPDPALVKRQEFNRQGNDDIDWAQWSWNPESGCRHDCPYCYARDIAVRLGRTKPDLYPAGFEPTFHPDQLLAPCNTCPPKRAEHDHRYKNVFVGSMTDLFGRWNPPEWIEAVLHAMAAAPQWNFLCLTKFPKRMSEFDIPSNVWMGTSIDTQARVAAAEAGFANVRSKVRWLSIEPMLTPLRFSRMNLFDWVVMGGASKSSQTPEWRPPVEWVFDVFRQAREAKAKVFMKTNLLGEGANRVMELPFDAPLEVGPQEAPAAFFDGKSKAEAA